ncbi:MAG: hypothetical protein OEV42_01105 [Deltaproteobacteria bacterium]|nr:hypothetical protein [Deltaproteobacteria bacterium]
MMKKIILSLCFKWTIPFIYIFAFNSAWAVMPADVDLVPTSVTPSVSAISTGEQMTVSSTIANQGTETIWSDFYSRIYLSTDAVITVVDQMVMSLYNLSLAAGAESTVDRVVTIPINLAPGTYYVGVIADYSDSQPEIDETNNALASTATIEVIRNVDLVPTSVVPSVTTINIGEQMTVSSTIANQGTSTTSHYFFNGAYLSTDAVITTADRLIASWYRGIAAGAESAVDSVVTIPTDLVPGTYYVGVIADYYSDAQPESDETNNALASITTIEVISP